MLFPKSRTAFCLASAFTLSSAVSTFNEIRPTQPATCTASSVPYSQSFQQTADLGHDSISNMGNAFDQVGANWTFSTGDTSKMFTKVQYQIGSMESPGQPQDFGSDPDFGTLDLPDEGADTFVLTVGKNSGKLPIKTRDLRNSSALRFNDFLGNITLTWSMTSATSTVVRVKTQTVVPIPASHTPFPKGQMGNSSVPSASDSAVPSSPQVTPANSPAAASSSAAPSAPQVSPANSPAAASGSGAPSDAPVSPAPSSPQTTPAGSPAVSPIPGASGQPTPSGSSDDQSSAANNTAMASPAPGRFRRSLLAKREYRRSLMKKSNYIESEVKERGLLQERYLGNIDYNLTITGSFTCDGPIVQGSCDSNSLTKDGAGWGQYQVDK